MRELVWLLVVSFSKASVQRPKQDVVKNPRRMQSSKKAKIDKGIDIEEFTVNGLDADDFLEFRDISSYSYNGPSPISVDIQRPSYETIIPPYVDTSGASKPILKNSLTSQPTLSWIDSGTDTSETIPSSDDSINLPSLNDSVNIPSSSNNVNIPSSNDISENIPSSNDSLETPSSDDVSDNIPSSEGNINVPSFDETSEEFFSSEALPTNPDNSSSYSSVNIEDYSPSIKSICSEPTERKLIIERRIFSISKKGLDVPSSPQTKAMNWIIDDDPIQMNGCSRELLERYSTVVIYFSLGGDLWYSKSKWLSGESICIWEGVTCDDSGKVNSLNLGMNNLQGFIESEISELRELKELRMFSNNIEGSIPDSFKELTKLEIVDFYDNKLNGTIPDALYQVRSLKSLHLANNFFSGTISSDIGELNNLTELMLSVNDLSGTIPDEIGLLSNLEYLILYSNKLKGSIPSSISLLKKLNWIDLSTNFIGGEIPNEFYELISLVNAYLSENNFLGTISSNIGSLTNLKQLFLSSNSLTGEIPNEISNLLLLETLLLNDNQLEGMIPYQSMSSLRKLQFLDVSTNRLKGAPFSENVFTKNLTKLKYVYLSNNTFTGTISSIVTDLVNLRHLWINNNSFSGDFPSVQPRNWPYLEELLLHKNDIVGSIPNTICALPSLETLGADCSYPPEVICECCTFCD